MAFNRPDSVTVLLASPNLPGSPSGGGGDPLEPASSLSSSSGDVASALFGLGGMTQSLRMSVQSRDILNNTYISSIRIMLPGGQDRKALLSLPSSMLRSALFVKQNPPSGSRIDDINVKLEFRGHGSGCCQSPSLSRFGKSTYPESFSRNQDDREEGI